jgi:hypothetical protein
MPPAGRHAEKGGCVEPVIVAGPTCRRAAWALPAVAPEARASHVGPDSMSLACGGEDPEEFRPALVRAGLTPERSILIRTHGFEGYGWVASGGREHGRRRGRCRCSPWRRGRAGVILKFWYYAGPSGCHSLFDQVLDPW